MNKPSTIRLLPNLMILKMLYSIIQLSSLRLM